MNRRLRVDRDHDRIVGDHIDRLVLPRRTIVRHERDGALPRGQREQDRDLADAVASDTALKSLLALFFDAQLEECSIAGSTQALLDASILNRSTTRRHANTSSE